MKKVKQFDIADEIFDEHEEDKYLIRKYVNSNFRIEVNSVDELMQYDSLVKSYVDNVIASGDINRVKDTISLLLFNASDGDMYDFNQTFGGTKKIDILVKKLGDS
uniref:hypothetical protein n=1 Tax=Candidatus Proelusimicrobium excrementi TaxID=3416222 RepID=UPI003D1364CE